MPPRLAILGEPLRGSAAPKTKLLLAYLSLYADQALERERIASALWPDVADADARKNLRRHLSLLKRLLPPLAHEQWIAELGSTLSWRSQAPAWLNVAEFERFTGGGSQRTAIDLYGGDLLSSPTMNGSFQSGTVCAPAISCCLTKSLTSA